MAQTNRDCVGKHSLLAAGLKAAEAASLTFPNRMEPAPLATSAVVLRETVGSPP